MREDFPTFDLPMNPNSGFFVSGQRLREGLLEINEAERMIMVLFLFEIFVRKIYFFVCQVFIAKIGNDFRNNPDVVLPG